MEASISPENSDATTTFKLWEPKILPCLGITFSSCSLSFAVATLFLQILETFIDKRSSSVAPQFKVHLFFRMLDLEWPITPPNLLTTKKLGSVYFAVNGIIAFRFILPQLHNPMSHEYYILFFATVFTNLIANPRSHKSKSNRSHRSKTNRSCDENRTQN